MAADTFTEADFAAAEKIVVNRHDLLTHPPLAQGVKPIQFGGKADFGSFGLLEDDGQEYLAKNLTSLFKVTRMQLFIKINHLV